MRNKSALVIQQKREHSSNNRKELCSAHVYYSNLIELRWPKQLAIANSIESTQAASLRVAAKEIGDQMKFITKLFLSLCLVVGLGATLTSNAQIDSNAKINVNIPHSFVVNNTTLPAGSYTVTVSDSESGDLNVLEIRSTHGKTAVFFETEPVNVTRTARHSELVFDKIGDTYFLSRVFMRGDEGGNQLLKSKKQKRLEEAGSTAESQSIEASPVRTRTARQTAKLK
jgi:hypothetical protein